MLGGILKGIYREMRREVECAHWGSDSPLLSPVMLGNRQRW